MAWSAGGVTESHVIFARWRWWCWSWLWLAWRQHAQVYLKYSVLLSVSAAVWAAALSGQQPGPGSGVSPLQLRRRGRVYTCPHCRLYSRPRPSLHRGLPQHNTWRLAGPLYAPWPHLSTVSSGRVLANLYRKLIAGQHCHRQGAEVIHRSNCCCC